MVCDRIRSQFSLNGPPLLIPRKHPRYPFTDLRFYKVYITNYMQGTSINLNAINLQAAAEYDRLVQKALVYSEHGPPCPMPIRGWRRFMHVGFIFSLS